MVQTSCTMASQWVWHLYHLRGVSIHWTGLLEWTTGLDYWTHPNCYKIPFKYRTKAKRAHSACYFDNVGSLASRGVFPSVSRGQRLCAYLISFNNWLNPVIYDLGILSPFCMLQNKGWSLASVLNKCPFRSLHQAY